MSNIASSPLFELIQSMSKGEKRHFKLYSRYHSPNVNEMNYLRLFDIIAKQKEYDEKKISAKGIVKKENLKVLKHYLYNLILESLRVLRSKEDGIDHKIKNMLENAYIMHDKGLQDEEMKFLKRTKELALKHERWGVLLEVLLIESRKDFVSAGLKAKQDMEEEINLMLIKLHNLLEYAKLNREMYVHVSKSGTQRNPEDETMKKLISHPLLSASGGEKALSAEAKKTYYNTIFLYHYFTGEDYPEAYKIISQKLHFIESNYSALVFPEITYSADLNRLTLVQHNLGKYQEALSTIYKHRSLVQQSGLVKVHAFIRSYINETNQYLLTGEFKKGTSIIKEIENGLVTLESKIPDALMFPLNVNIAGLYFGAGEYRKSLVWVNKIINNPKVIFREDIQSGARILQILIHYELRTPDILEHLLVSAYRFLLKRKLLYKVEKSMLDFIRRLDKTDTTQKVLMKEFGRFRDELLQITKAPEEKKALISFDWISWLESKIENRPFAEVVKEKASSK